MYKMTYLIYDTLQKVDNLKVSTRESKNSSSVCLKFSVNSGETYTIRFISNDDNNDVSVRVFALLSVEEFQRPRVLPILNSLNAKYRYLKFVLDEDGDINVEYDYAQKCPDPAASAVEIVKRIVTIIGESFPIISRAMNS